VAEAMVCSKSLAMRRFQFSQASAPHDNPAPGKHLEALGDVRWFDDFDGPLADPAQGIAQFVASTATIRERHDAARGSARPFRQVPAAPRRGPEDIGGMRHRIGKIAIGVGQDVPLAPFDFLAGVVSRKGRRLPWFSRSGCRSRQRWAKPHGRLLRARSSAGRG